MKMLAVTTLTLETVQLGTCTETNANQYMHERKHESIHYLVHTIAGNKIKALVKATD